MEQKEYIERYEQGLMQHLLRMLTIDGKLGGQVLVTGDLTDKWNEIASSYVKDSVKEIAEAMKEQLGLDVDKKKISIANPIRNEGTFSAAVKLHPQVTAELSVKVEGN